MLHSPNRVRVHLSALVANLGQVRRLVSPPTKIMGVVKSDAYGHGLVPVGKALEGRGVDCLGIAHLVEALELRKSGVRCPLVLLCGIRSREEATKVVEENLTAVVYDLETARWIAGEAGRAQRRVNVHVKVDTGMGRLGVPHREVGEFLRHLMDLRVLKVEGLTSHLSCADDCSKEFTRLQIEHFRDAIARGRVLGLDLPLNNLANSAAVMGHRESHFDMVRPGIMLYGGLPSPDYPGSAELRPGMDFTGTVLQVRDLPGETAISYGRTYTTERPKKVAVLSAGYGDGLPRSLSNRGKVLIGGRRCDILGRVCMNMIVCDVTGVENVAEGDEAVFLGTQGGATITGDDVARWGDTISYEVFCSIGQRHQKEYAE